MRSGRVLLALAALAALGACVHGEAVVKLTEANFDELVGVGTDPQAPHFIEFFAPWYAALPGCPSRASRSPLVRASSLFAAHR